MTLNEQDHKAIEAYVKLLHDLGGSDDEIMDRVRIDLKELGGYRPYCFNVEGGVVTEQLWWDDAWREDCEF